MELDEAVRVVRDQTIPALRGSGGDGHAEAIERVLLEVARLTHDCETLRLMGVQAEAKEKPYRCECGDTDPRHHHCGISGWDPMRDARCPGCAPPKAKP